MLEYILGVLGLWGFLGYFIGPFIPEPKTRVGAALQLIMIGPTAWILGPIIFIQLYLKARRKRNGL